jgi:hypothetical protein
MDGSLTLRAFRQEDLGFLDRLETDPAALGGFEWFGFTNARKWRKRWEQDGLITPESANLAVVSGDGTVIGITSWKAIHRGGSPGCCFEIGAALLPSTEARGWGRWRSSFWWTTCSGSRPCIGWRPAPTPTTWRSRRYLNASASPGRAFCARSPSGMGPGGTPWSTHSSATTSQDGETSHSLSWLWIDGSECQGLSIRSA